MYYGCHPEGWCCIDVHCVRTDRCDVSNEALEMPLQLPRDQATGSCMMFLVGLACGSQETATGVQLHVLCYIVCSLWVSTWATQQVRWNKDGARATKDWQEGSLWWRNRQSGPLLKMQISWCVFRYVWCLEDFGNCHCTKSESMTLCFDFRLDHQFVPARA